MDSQNFIDNGANMAHEHQECCVTKVSEAGRPSPVTGPLGTFVGHLLYSHSTNNIPPPRLPHVYLAKG